MNQWLDMKVKKEKIVDCVLMLATGSPLVEESFNSGDVRYEAY